MRDERATIERGFSLAEMMTSMAILLVIAGASFAAMGGYQRTYVNSQAKSDLYFGIRGAAELITQEVAQAGMVSLPANTLNAAVTGSSTAQAVTLASAFTTIFVGEKLLIDAGPNEELVAVTAVVPNTKTVTGVFTKSHASGAPVNAMGVFPQGIMSASTNTSLKLFGDINGDGTLYYVEYNCDTSAGTLTRSSTPITITATSKNASDTLLSNLIPTTGMTGCFYIPSATTAAGFTFIPYVGVTLSVQTTTPAPSGGVYTFKMTKSFLNVNPRNVVGGLEMANNNITTRLQPTPTNLPLT